MKKQYTHIRKPGWVGIIYERPWGLPDHLDIMWVSSPNDVHKHRRTAGYPDRYPIRDLREVSA